MQVLRVWTRYKLKEGKEMKQTMTSGRFIENFPKDRYNQMGGYEGLMALWEHLERYEEGTGEEMEFDPIALCCEFTQYDSIEEVLKNYASIKDLDDLKDNTQVIEYGDGKLIIQDF
jgi:hypothetical protein